jgi:uncharacterized membrane protein YgcG
VFSKIPASAEAAFRTAHSRATDASATEASASLLDVRVPAQPSGRCRSATATAILARQQESCQPLAVAYGGTQQHAQMQRTPAASTATSPGASMLAFVRQRKTGKSRGPGTKGSAPCGEVGKGSSGGVGTTGFDLLNSKPVLLKAKSGAAAPSALITALSAADGRSTAVRSSARVAARKQT